MARKKFGAHKDWYKARRTNKVAEKNHLKRVLQSSGLKAAREYAEQNDLRSYLEKLGGAS